METSENEKFSGRRIICIGCTPSFLYNEKDEKTAAEADPRIIMLSSSEEIREYFADPAAEDWFSTVRLQTAGRCIFFRVKDLLFVETKDNYLDIVLDNSVIERVAISLRRFLAAVGSRYIVRCHRAFAVNIRKIIEIKKAGRRRWDLILNTCPGKTCPAGAAYYKELMKKMEESCRSC